MYLRYVFLLLFVVMIQNAYAQDLPVKLADDGKKTVEVGKQIQIAADLKNNQDIKQDFAYIVQIQNEDGVTVSLAWITGTLEPAQSFTPALSWIPNEEGTYEATIFVWESIDNPTALSPTLTLGIDVNQIV
ncbi:MAG TPA: hypothetical protein VD828_03845 [Candidatus Nitrosotenuis sp.]|nr:hypothetical protein [Candidatus Nitrosotenuis sp.]